MARKTFTKWGKRYQVTHAVPTAKEAKRAISQTMRRYPDTLVQAHYDEANDKWLVGYREHLTPSQKRTIRQLEGR